MINAKLIEDQGILVVSPVGKLEATDFERLGLLADPYIQKHGKLNGLMIEARSFPGWEDFAALQSHIHFVNDHHKKVKRIAAVSDNNLLKILPHIANHFVAAEVRHFDYKDRDKAIEWLRNGASITKGR